MIGPTFKPRFLNNMPLSSMRGVSRTLAFFAVGSSLAAPVAAQNPMLLPASSDSIYRLAVDSAAYRDYPFVYLLDDGIVHYDADGKGTEQYHQVVQILKQDAVESMAEREFSYRPGHGKVTVNWMRVVRPSGQIISDKPSITQASDVPAAMESPIYSDTKVMRYSLAGVAVGTLVDVSWTVETEPYLRGDFTSGWRTTMAYPAMRSRFVLDVPASSSPRIVEHHVDIRRVEQQQGGRHFYVWAKQNVTPVKGELFAPDSSVPAMSIDVGSSIAWHDIANWYAGLAKDRYSLSPHAIAIVDSVVRHQRTAADTVNALHTWIARDIRYVSVALGLGGYQPRFPDSTIVAGFGDCKDKATLFIAAAKHLGLTAYPVLLNSTGVPDRTLASVGMFDHVIAALPAKAGGYQFLDLTTDAFALGHVPPSYQGEFGLVVLPNDRSDEITFPKDSAGASVMKLDGIVGPDGIIAGRIDLTAHGRPETMFRAMFREKLDSATRASAKQAFSSIVQGHIDSLVAFDGRDPKAEARITLLVSGVEGFKRAGSLEVLTIPPVFHGPASGAAAVLRRLGDAQQRKLPIDVSEIVGDAASETDFRLTLPEGWTAELPKGAVLTSDFGEYRSEYTQDGRVLKLSTRITGKTGVLPKERYNDLVAWLKAVSGNALETIVVRTPAQP